MRFLESLTHLTIRTRSVHAFRLGHFPERSHLRLDVVRYVFRLGPPRGAGGPWLGLLGHPGRQWYRSGHFPPPCSLPDTA